jgi:sensor histidine kinase YesM
MQSPSLLGSEGRSLRCLIYIYVQYPLGTIQHATARFVRRKGENPEIYIFNTRSFICYSFALAKHPSEAEHASLGKN